MKKELIIIFGLYSIGGTQRRAFNLANEFFKKGFSVSVLSVLGKDHRINEGHYHAEKNVEYVNVPDYYAQHQTDAIVTDLRRKNENKIKRLKKLQSLFSFPVKIDELINFCITSLRKSIELKSFLVSHPNATVISFGFNIFERTYFAVKGLKNKIIYVETNAAAKYEKERFAPLIKRIIKKSNALIFQTEEELAEHKITKRSKSYIIHNPIKEGLPKPYVGNREKSIVTFCRLIPQKNLLLLVKAFEMLLKEIPDYKLEMYADSSDPTNECQNEIVSYISSHKLNDSVFILPTTPYVHSLILKSAMFVSSSDYEGISNSMIEAMAIGLPCVCTDCGGGGAREMITDGENGLLVPIKDAEALKNAMIRMITEKGLAEKCSKNAAEIRRTHSVEKISEKWLDVINNI